jgi:hypothetical protein
LSEDIPSVVHFSKQIMLLLISFRAIFVKNLKGSASFVGSYQYFGFTEEEVNISQVF